MSSESPVELVCIKVGSKLRVRIKTPGYLNEANCQFPRDLRIEGRRFSVPACQVRLVESRGKHFQSVPKGVATILESKAPAHIYEDSETSECAICLSEPKAMVFVPCGHQQCCTSCTTQLQTCPICREPIKSSILKTKLLD